MNKDQLDYSSYMRWKSNEFTILFRNWIEEAKQSSLDVILHSHINDLTMLGKYLGKIQALDDLLSITFTDLTGKDEIGN